MRAVILTGKNEVLLQEVPAPRSAMPGHVIIKMVACGINSGDKLFISGAFPRGIPASRYSIAGVSGVGTVVETGEGVPDSYKGKNVAVYRSLRASEETLGTWSEYAHLHYLNCAIIPASENIESFSGSLVNVITPYAFFKQTLSEGHRGIICTGGNTATGIAMLGICLINNFPIISIVRSEKAASELKSLGAVNVLVQTDLSFKQQLKELSERLNTTAIFDGIGGKTLTEIIDMIPFNSTIYSYGFLDAENPFCFSTKLLMKGITVRGFSNFRTQTVLDPQNLEHALNEISNMLHMPHFRTRAGKRFSLDEAAQALRFSSPGGKAILYN